MSQCKKGYAENILVNLIIYAENSCVFIVKIKNGYQDKIQLETAIVGVLKTVYDPEIPVDVYALGLIYNIDIDDNWN